METTESINAITDKPTRGKAKAMMVKIKRGAVERPKMPELSSTCERLSTSDKLMRLQARPKSQTEVSSENKESQTRI